MIWPKVPTSWENNMQRLSYQALGTLDQQTKVPGYDLNTTGAGIVHLGPGAFHRAHQAVYTDMAMAYGGDWRITAVSMRSKGVRDSLAQQDNLYTLAVLDENPYLQVVGAFKQVLVLSDQRQQVMEALYSPDTHIISLTITEKGYCLNSQGKLDVQHSDIKHDLANPEQPVSAVGLITLALKYRYEHDFADITVISCDNLSDNGDKLKNAVVSYASELSNELADWIANNICFPNTMVDSITPATDDSLKQQVSRQLGVEDDWPIQREAFTQWVVEDKFSGPRPKWEKVGVTFTDDVNLYEKAKLRVLNGTHSTLAYLGLLFGFETVYEGISNPAIESLIRRLLDEEILPSLGETGKMDPKEYGDAILQRYHNKHIRHLLAQIAWDGSQKLPFRILNTIRDNIKFDRSISLLCVPIAAWLLFLKSKHQDASKLTDPLAEELLSKVDAAKSNEDLVDKILSVETVFAELGQHSGFVTSVKAHVALLSKASGENIESVLGTL